MSKATRHAARLAASALLCCILAPAHAQQSSAPPSDKCEARRQAGPQDAPCELARKPERDAPARRECARLRTAIQESEQAERGPRAPMMESVQQDLGILRQRYKKLGCL